TEPDGNGLQRADLEGIACRWLGAHQLSAKHGTDRGGLALESQRNLERRPAAERLLHGKRRAQGVSAAFLRISAPASRKHPRRRLHRQILALDRRRSGVLLEKQSVSDQEIHE